MCTNIIMHSGMTSLVSPPFPTKQTLKKLHQQMIVGDSNMSSCLRTLMTLFLAVFSSGGGTHPELRVHPPGVVVYSSRTVHTPRGVISAPPPPPPPPAALENARAATAERKEG